MTNHTVKAIEETAERLTQLAYDSFLALVEGGHTFSAKSNIALTFKIREALTQAAIEAREEAARICDKHIEHLQECGEDRPAWLLERIAAAIRSQETG